MKTVLTAVLFPIVVLIIGYYFTHEKADIIYILSDKIPTKISDGKSSENVQQLEVRNIGSKEAQQIQLIIKGDILSYDLIKYSKADAAKEFSSSGSTEIMYPALPPQASFKVLIKSIGDGLGLSSITVSHSLGKGREAFSNESSYATFLMVIPLLFWALVLIWVFRTGAIDHLDAKACGYGSDEILKKKRKPFYVGQDKWHSIRKKSIEHRITSGGIWDYRDIVNSQSYIFLNSEKPGYLNEEEWNALLKIASKELSNIFSEARLESIKVVSVLKLLNIKRPKFISEDDWEKIIVELEKTLIYIMKTDYSLKDIDGLIKSMKDSKPDEVSVNTWTNYQKFLEDEYYRLLSIEMAKTWLHHYKPIEYLEKHDLHYLSRDKADALKKSAYKLQLEQLPDVLQLKGAKKFVEIEKPYWIIDTDYNNLLDVAQRIITLNDKINKYDCLNSELNAVVFGQPLGASKPEFLADEEWEKIIKLHDLIRLAKLDRDECAKDQKEASSLKEKCSKEREEMLMHKDKISRQLEIIHNLIIDPSSIERIEDYSNPFSIGNFENLKRLSMYLKAKG